MNGAVASVLNRVLGDWIDNLNSENLNLSIFSGQILLQDLNLKKSAFHNLGLPFQLEYGHVGKIYASIPWTALSTSPMRVLVEDIHIFLSPLKTEDWKPEVELSRRVNQKLTTLKQLEALKSSEIESKTPGFVEKLVGKIVYNLQIEVKNVYFQYSDDISSSQKFSFGVVLRSLKAVTCNSLWNEEFLQETSLLFKLVQISDFKIFLDYEKNSEDPPQQVACKEFESSPEHNFLMPGCTFRLEAIVNKDKADLSLPQLRVDFKISEFNAELDTVQLKHALKTVNFINLFSTFQKGVFQENPEVDFSPEEAEKYRILFMQSKTTTKNKAKLESIIKELEEIESRVKYQDLVQQRGLANKELELAKLEAATQEEIVSASAAPSTLSKLSGFFSRKPTNNDEEKKEKIAKLREKLNQINETREKLKNEVENFIKSDESPSEFPEDYIKQVFKFSIETVQMKMSKNSEDLLEVLISSPSIDIELANNFFNLNGGIEGFQLSDLQEVAIFSDIVKSGCYSITITNKSVLSVSMKSGDLNVYTKIRPILKTLEAFKDPFVNEFDYTHYTKNAEEKTKQYISAGEKYLATAIKEGINVTINIDIDLKAPTIYLPINPSNPELGVLVVDFGKVQISNKPRRISNHLYDMYSFRLIDFAVWTDTSYSENKKSGYLLNPISIELSVFKSLGQSDNQSIELAEVQFLKEETIPNLLVHLNLHQIIINIEDSDLIFLDSLKNSLVKELEQVSKPPPINKDLIKLNEKIEVSIVFQFNFKLTSFVLNLVKDGSKFISAEITGLALETLVIDSKNIICKFYLAYIEMRDERKDIKINKIICNPALLPTDDEEFADALEELKQFSGEVLVAGSTSVKLSMNDLRIVLSPDLVTDFLHFSRGLLQEKPSTSVETNQKKPQKNAEIQRASLSSDFSLKLELSNITLLLPLDNRSLNHRVGSFNLSVSLDYSLQRPSIQENFSENDEALILNVKRITSIVGLFSNNVVKNTHQKTRNLLEPTQFFLRYNKKNSEKAAPSFKFSLDNTYIDFGLRDADFLKKLVDNWSVLSSTKKENPSSSSEIPFINFEICSSDIIVQLNDDTSLKPENLLQLTISQTILRGTADRTIKNLEFRSRVSSICQYSEDVEDFIESWDFSILSRTNPESQSLETILSSENALNVNISERMIKNLTKLKRKFKEKPELWEEERKDESSGKTVKITNFIGEDVIISLPDSSPKIIDKGKSFEIETQESTSHFIFEVNNSDQVYLDVDMKTKEFNVKRSGNYVGCMLKVKEDSEENEMVLQTQTFYYNLTDKVLEFSWEAEKISVSPNQKTSLPLNFCGRDVKVLTDSGPSIFSTSFSFGSTFVSVEKLSLKDSENFVYLYYIFLPSFYVQNLLPCPIQLLNNPLSNIRCYLLPGETKPFPINPKSLGKMQISFYISDPSASSWFELGNSSTKVKIPSNNQRIMVESTDFDIFSIFSSFVPINRNINCKLFHIYSRYIVVNKTLSNIEIKKNLIIEKNSIGFLRCKKEKIKFRALHDGKWTGFSRDVNGKTVGLTGCISLDNPRSKNLEVLFGVQILSAPLPLVKSKTIIVTPRFFVHNSLGRPVFVRQVFDKGPSGQILQLADERNHFQLENSFESKNIQISTNGKHWSKTFSIEDIDDFQISLETLPSERGESDTWFFPNPSNDNRFYVQVNVFTFDQACIMINFKYPKDPEFLIKNNIEHPITLVRSNFSFILEPSTQIPWADSDHITIRVGKNEVAYNLVKVEKKTKQINNIRAEVRISKVTRILEFGEYKSDNQQADSYKMHKFEISMSIGLSFFSDNSSELLFISISKFYASALIKSKEDKQVIIGDLRIQSLQVDNMQKEENQYPVIIAGLNDPETPFFQAKIETRSTSSYRRFPWIEVIFQETCIQLNLEVIYKIIDILSKYKELVIEENVFIPKENSTIFENFPDLNPVMLDLEDKSSKNEKIYVSVLRLYAIKLLISFKVPQRKLDLKLNPLIGFGIASSAKTLLSSFANITDSSINFTEIIVTDSFQFPEKYVKTISQNYAYQGIRQVYRLLGSSDMLGNPIRLMGKLGTGVFEFISEPMKGLLKGPKALPGGVKKGVKSLVSNIVGGGMHSVSTITGNLYNVVNKVKGANQEDLSSEKIKGSIVGGLKDITKGVTGIFSKPWEGLKKEGGTGLVKGIGSGIFGAVSAPLSAGLRVASGISTEVTGAVSAKRPDLLRLRDPKSIKRSK